jgi:hypothetical protein
MAISIWRLRLLHRLGLMVPLLRFERWISGRDLGRRPQPGPQPARHPVRPQLAARR